MKVNQIFWGSFIALITTSMAFIIRALLISNGMWVGDFGLDKVESGVLFGAGIWPFAISIILFSLIIDRIGYKVAMIFSFICYAIFGAMAVIAYGMVHEVQIGLEAAQAKAWTYLYWGSVILGVGNGTVEAFINPVIATIFKEDKSSKLNSLHAGWPAGLILGGLFVIMLSDVIQGDWRILVGLIFLPALIYVTMLISVKFPLSERVASGTTYKQMLAEFGAIGAFIAFYLIIAQLGTVFNWSNSSVWIATGVITVAYGLYSRSLGNPILLVLLLIMMPLAITELGTDSWISSLMEKPMHQAGLHPGWVLIYASLVMMILRFNAKFMIVKLGGALGLLVFCSLIAILGLYLLSFAQSVFFIFLAATIYGFAKAFFWPTMLGLAAEQTPKGGALTLNAIAGIGMLSVGILGGPFIGYLQEHSVSQAMEQKVPQYYQQATVEKQYLLGSYRAIDTEKLAQLPAEAKNQIDVLEQNSTQGALAKMAIFPAVMFVAYLGLIIYFKSKGGYKAKTLDH